MTYAQKMLEYIRGEIRAGRISYGEIAELQALAKCIDPGDFELLEWAGEPEFPDTECEVCHNTNGLHDTYCPRQPGAFPKGD
jgi:hypothetical protein